MRKNIKTKIMAGMISFMMVFQSAGAYAEVFAADSVSSKAAVQDSGECGTNLKWSYDGEVLTIEGQGDMIDGNVVFDEETGDILEYDELPWDDYFESIKEIVIKEGVTSIGDYAFFYISALEKVSLPNSLTEIGNNAFLLCDNLTSVSFGSGLKKIGEYAFSETALTSVVLPESVTEVKEGAFFLCDKLNSITFSKNMKIIPNGCCYENTALIKVVIPENMTTINKYAFDGCTALSAVTLPFTVTTVSENAFSANTRITYADKNIKVYFKGNGGTLTTTSKTVTYKKKFGSLPTPKRKGYTFAGWYTSASGGTKVVSSTQVTKTTNMNLYAHWKKVTVPRVTLKSASNYSGKKAKAVFNKVSGAAGYQIAIAQNSSFKKAKYITVSSSASSYMIKNLTKGKTYYIKIRAYKKDSMGNKVYGSYSKVKKVIIKK